MRLSVLILCALVVGCGDTPPPCASEGDGRAAPSAGCLVWNGDAVLLVRGWRGGWALPGGSVKPGESASCGAEREVFEEAGIPVTATQLATVFDNGFHLYWCRAAANVSPHIHRPLEVREVAWRQPDVLGYEQWRYPGQGMLIRDLLSDAEYSTED